MKNTLFALFVLVFIASTEVKAIDTKDTRMLSQPALSSTSIAFVYANDIWAANLDGSNPRRLTSHPGTESSPHFSPDGKWIAFTGDYDGNTDVFIIPSEGGVPKRLTWHPYGDYVQGFTPDGKYVLFVSGRNSFRTGKLFKVPIEGGYQEEYPLPCVYRADISPDQEKIAYNPLADAFVQWKNYRGGRFSEIWIATMADLNIVKIPQPATHCNDITPLWAGNKILFTSDRNGEFNLFSFDMQSKEIKQLTQYNDFPVMSSSVSGNNALYEQAGYLYTLDLITGKSSRLKIGVATELPEIRERFVKGEKYIRSFAPSPSGARVVFETRGEIITIPAEKGDFRNITNSPSVNERSPDWSADGKSIAYFSDESGEYKLVVENQDGSGQTKSFALNGAGYYYSLQWAPDNQKLSFTDNSSTRYWIDLKSGKMTRIGSDYYYLPFGLKSTNVSWSSDSRWIAYAINNSSNFQQIYLYSIDQDKSFPLTDGLSEASEPVFDASGKYVWFFSSTDAGPVNQWFDQSNADMRMSNSIYIAILKKGIESPFMKESDEEKASDKDKEKDSKAVADKQTPKKKDKEKVSADTTAKIEIDLDGLSDRIVSVPLAVGFYWNLQPGNAGQVFYQEEPKPEEGRVIGYSGEKAKVHRYDSKTKKDEVQLSDINIYVLTRDKNKILYQSGETYGIVNASEKTQVGQGKINISGMEIKINPIAEWKEIYNEAWRINRDYFYDPGMQGANWKAMKEKYAVFLPDLACRNDLGKIIRWLCSELSVGHSFSGGGDFLYKPDFIKGGLLGADFSIENGKYRIKKILGGLNWTPDLRSPLAEPGLEVHEGDYLLAVNGKELIPPDDLYAHFENTAGKITTVTISNDPAGKGSRTIKVVPVSDEGELRMRDWVEGNLLKVQKATNGRVAYVYVPNTAKQGYDFFKRYFFPQVGKEALILDERYNGGGSIADYYIDILRRPFISMWATRYGNSLSTPSSSILGPKVMLVNEYAGSGGDLLPWMFRKYGIGKIIGKRTWGGLVGILGYPQLLDGAYVTAPNLAIWNEDGWVVENEGISPDIEVEQLPSELNKGNDPQLEMAIKTVMDELNANPVKKLKQPPFPVRVRKN